jgi:polysaccharide biosynthesis protein PslF
VIAELASRRVPTPEVRMTITARDPSIGFVSTYPPTVCGLASFTAALLNAVAEDRGTRSGLGVVDLSDGTAIVPNRDVAFHHRTGNTSSLARAIQVLNTYDTVSIQHEFGIYGGRDGVEVIDLIGGLDVPVAVTLHTVLDRPSPRQRAIVKRLADLADRMVVMSETASRRLIRGHGIDPDLIDIIPHGVDEIFAGPSLVSGDRPLVLTWGLIGPGKGLEWAIESFAGLTDLDPRPRYLIAGATHPHVLEAAGDTYRESLVALVRRYGLEDVVEFDDRYLDRASLARMVRSADVVVLPYESLEQVTSGVLVEAIAAAKPVVATRFPHAVELLDGGAGVTVPHGDPASLSRALRRVLTDRRAMESMGREAKRLADGWYWPTIGRRHGMVMSELAAAVSPVGTLPAAGVLRVAG